ncbi:MAG: SHOCT domain-containing protein [Woeseiaceae bacterium]|nr:SHOCT domain-containing protein [Woeseiaceae bacterium]
MAGMWLWWAVAIAIVVGIVWAVRRSAGNTGTSAEELLKRRYAQGEIDKDEYEKRLRDLRQ